MRSTRQAKSHTRKPTRSRAATISARSRRRKRRTLPWKALLLPAGVLYFVLLIQVETLLSSASRKTEKLHAVRDSLRTEAVLASAGLDERLCLESIIPLTRERGLEHVLPDQALVVPGVDGNEPRTVLASVLHALAVGMGPTEARASEAEKAARRTLAAVGLP